MPLFLLSFETEPTHPMNITPLKCLVVDDESIAAEGIADYIARLDFLHTTALCSSSEEAADRLKNESVDLMFLDINMPGLSGIEWLKSLPAPPLTILTTAYSEYALESYELNVIDYLLKPIRFDRFAKAARKAYEAYTSRLSPAPGHPLPDTDMYIRQGVTFKKISWKDILFAESMQNYVKIHFEERTLVIHQTMTSLEKRLPENFFFRVHRSFLVNLLHIDSVRGNKIYIRNHELPVSSGRMETLLESAIYKKLLSK